MGIFDIFTTTDQQNAANDQIRGLNAGYGLASDALKSGIGALTSNYGTAANALTSNYGTAAGALSSGYGQAGNALTSTYGAALAPFLQNYNQAQGGVTQLGNVLGLNGPAGSDAALAALRNTPGYKFQQGTLDDTVNAAAAASGNLASGNQLLALNKVNQGLADTTYNNYVSQLQPFLGASNAAASGIGSTLTGLGSNLAGTYTGLGGSLGNLYTGLGGNLAGTYTGLGQGLAGQYGSLANLGYQTQTGIGNANANADLAGLTQSQNILGFGLNAAKLGASIFSDERLKEDIQPVGELYDGTNVYAYRYKGDATPRIGLMAQEVEQTNPDAVVEIGGYKAIDYGKAVDLAASLGRFMDDAKVVPLDDRRAAKQEDGYASDLSRFLEAA